MTRPEEGYTTIIACNAPLAPMLAGNLEMLRRQDRENLKEVIVVFDRTRRGMDCSFEEETRRRFPELPLRFIYYGKRQASLGHGVRSPWIYCWMSWSIAIAAVKTRYVFLHDFDAFLIRPDFCEDRYRAIRELGVQYLGIQHYRWGDLTEADGFVQTFELMFDAAFVRERFKPVTLFNRFRRIKGRRVELDTFLDAQHLGGDRRLQPALPTDLVHPGQVICQFVQLMHSRRYVPPAKNNLLWIPYFILIGGDPRMIDDVTVQLEASTDRSIGFFGKRMDLSALSAEHVEKTKREMLTLERGVAGTVRPAVARYLAAIAAIQGSTAAPAARATQPA